MSLLQNIQNKPEHIRWRILYALLFVCMFFVFLIWISTLQLGVLSKKEAVAKEGSAQTQTTSPFSLLKKTGSLVFNDFLGGLENIKSNVINR